MSHWLHHAPPFTRKSEVGFLQQLRRNIMPIHSRIVAAARLELLLVTWRIGEAMRSLNEDPDRRTEMRWNHGIARELWFAVEALGIQAAASALAPGTVGSAPDPLANLLGHASWNADLSLSFNVVTFNRAAFLAMLKPDAANFERLDVARGHDRWWTWPTEAGDDVPRASWWNVPVAFVPRPVTMHSSDLSDMHRQFVHLAGELDRLVLAKTRMTETITERVAELERDLYSVV
ncbi:hypothetical protein C8Q76DRAFT_801518 [Earliella scabrosa]|nr:hypothetical protein C8Q76DRAFT_801518 [Earliella scabrosa]